MLLRNLNAIVTGSSRGIGKAIALRFAEEGANVVVNYLGKDDEAQKTSEAIRTKGVKTLEVQADIGKSDEVRHLISRTMEEFGSVDILVNNAGSGLTKPFEQIKEDEWERMLAVHLKGVFLATQLVGETMRKQGGGSIINISSVAGKVALPQRVIYSAVQGGKMMFTRALACEWARWGIRINSIAPGTILTDLVRRNFDLGLLDGGSVLQRTPMARFGETSEVAGVAAFLASGDASYVTGQTIFVDGGWTSWAGWPLPPTKS
ncbi:MAG: SDR family NAD(P)-dependent oxidoreductase [Candidatus Acidiferrales bacterium]